MYSKGQRKSLTKELIKLSLPIVLSNLAYTLLGAVDTFFMGIVGTLALGAVGIGSITFITATVVFKGIIAGTTPFVSRAYGSKDPLTAGRYLKFFYY